MPDFVDLKERLRVWAREMGFQQIGVTDIDLEPWRRRLQNWLDEGMHGDMHWMKQRAEMRLKPELLNPGTRRVISCRMNYLPEGAPDDVKPQRARIARYAQGRDYHKTLRRRLRRLAERLGEAAPHDYRVFTDSAPMFERALAVKAGLGWVGKNTMLIDRRAGSWFFLGEILTDLPLPLDEPLQREYCGACHACLDACPTDAFVAPHRLDARRCIAYLNIEYKGSIPEELRPAFGNRVFGCDECQSACPWNKNAPAGEEEDFRPRHGLNNAQLCDLFAWDEAQYLQRTEGSALRRVGYECWLRNLAVALGNAPPSPRIKSALRKRADHPSALVREHVAWALRRQQATP